MKLLFVTDLHGGNAVFRKCLRLYGSVKADFLVVGGDIAGKYIAPVIDSSTGWRISTTPYFGGQKKGASVKEIEQQIGDVGGYPLRCTATEAKRLAEDETYFEEVLRIQRVARLRTWIARAMAAIGEKQFLINLGNDDPFYLDIEVLAGTGRPALEYRDVDLPGGWRLVSCGYVNKTPWNCPRDIEDEALLKLLTDKMSQCPHPRRVVANFHCPPAFSTLDRAPALDDQLRPIIGVDGVESVHVGSRAVRNVIESFSPAVALHGHVHESYGKESIGKTLCVNPGSAYATGELRAALVHLEPDGVMGVQLIREH
jgi:uncharacterized protein